MAIDIIYILSAALFILGLKMLNHPDSARRGNMLSAVGMFAAILVTLIHKDIIDYRWIIISIALGSVIGGFASKYVQMTQMPEMVALFNGFGGAASLFVGWSVYLQNRSPDIFNSFTLFLSVFIGGVTFSGSMIAWAKLANIAVTKPVLFKGQKVTNLLLLILSIICGAFFSLNPSANYTILLVIIFLSLLFGITAVIPIGGADMPVIISLLNSYSGLAACAAGFVIHNIIVIVAGSLVGASGIILTQIMCKAMNRSLLNVLLSGLGADSTKKGAHISGNVKESSVQDAYFAIEAADSVAIVPGYGLAVAQAQHSLRELGELMEDNGTEILYVIHPVAGRMPGHMNVLLSEANVSYDKLREMDDINPHIENIDICIVIGANDVVNPSARDDPKSPLYGMPIINADRAKSVFVIKRSLSPGFAGVENPLFYKDNTRMIFGDAKAVVEGIIGEFKDAPIH